MKPSILYIGPDSGTSRQRASALRRLGHRVHVLDSRKILPDNRVFKYWNHHTGTLFLESVVRRNVIARLPSEKFTLVWVDGGHLIGPSLVSELKERYGRVINYNLDDPYGGRDGLKWRLYLKSVGVYDLVVVVRDCNRSEAMATGAKDVLVVSRCADEVAHAPRDINECDRLTWASEVLFVGTWMPERGPFLARLVELAVPLTIYGDNWSKASEWRLLKRHWRGMGLYSEDDYCKAVQCASVCLGLLSKGNRDFTTQRSFEIPYLKAALCAERTTEHLNLYRENVEATFWSSPAECAEKCHRLLEDVDFRNVIAAQGRLRCIANQTLNEPVLAHIAEAAMSRRGKLRDEFNAKAETARSDA